MPETVETQNPVTENALDQEAGTPEVVTQNPAVGEKAIQRLISKLMALPEDLLRSPRVDVMGAAMKALAMDAGITPEMRARFRAMPPSEFDITLLDDLQAAAQAVVHTRAQLMSLQAIDPNLRLPVGDAQQAGDLRERMLQVLEYHLGTDLGGEYGDAVRKLRHIRSGQGHLDQAMDLDALAGLYRDFAGLLADDTRRYDAADVGRAEELAARIRSNLGVKKARRRSPEQLLATRAWTFLAHAYEEVAATGRWLTRNEPVSATLFSPLGEGLRRRRASASQPATIPAAQPASTSVTE